MSNMFFKRMTDSLVDLVKEKLDDNDYVVAYGIYLKNKYSKTIEEIAMQETDEILNAIINSFIQDEISIIKNETKDELLSRIKDDDCFKQLMFLNEIAFEKAKKCKLSNEAILDEVNYRDDLLDLSACIDGIQPFNLKQAKELLAEAILDIEYTYGKSEVMSLRLSRV